MRLPTETRRSHDHTMAREVISALSEWNPNAVSNPPHLSSIEVSTLDSFFKNRCPSEIKHFLNSTGLFNSEIQFHGVHVMHSLKIDFKKSKLSSNGCEPSFLHIGTPIGEKPCQDCGPLFLRISADVSELELVQVDDLPKFKTMSLCAADFLSGVLAGCHRKYAVKGFQFQRSVIFDLQDFERLSKKLSELNLHLHPSSRGACWTLFKTYDAEVSLRKTQAPASQAIALEAFIASRDEKRLEYIASRL